MIFARGDKLPTVNRVLTFPPIGKRRAGTNDERVHVVGLGRYDFDSFSANNNGLNFFVDET